MTLAGTVLDENVPGWKVFPHRHHHLSGWRQFVRDVRQLVNELHRNFRATVVVLTALAVETSTVFALSASGHPLWAMFVMLAGGSGIAVGVAVKAMGSGKS